VLALEGVGFSRGQREILRDIDLAVTPGRVTVAIGQNGAGKSTLLGIMSGLLRPHAGRCRIHDRDVATLKPAELARWRAVLGQSISLTTPFTVEEVVRLGLPARTLKETADQLIGRALADVSLGEFRLRQVTTLSGGEQQRAHIARVMLQLRAQSPDARGHGRYLLLDEPTAHLDPAYQLALARVVRAFAAEGGGVFAILHDLNLAAALADEIVVLREGRIIASGAPQATLTATLLHKVYGIAFSVQATSCGLSIIPEYRGAE
jgi:iron complex transport system ATP-binding protein